MNFYAARSFFETKGLKYVSCSASKNIIGFELFINFEQPITLVEGPFDAIAVKNNCIPLFGKTLSKQLKLKLLEHDVPMVHILLDNDAIKDSIKICEFLIKNSIIVFDSTIHKTLPLLNFSNKGELSLFGYTVAPTLVENPSIGKNERVAAWENEHSLKNGTVRARGYLPQSSWRLSSPGCGKIAEGVHWLP